MSLFYWEFVEDLNEDEWCKITSVFKLHLEKGIPMLLEVKEADLKKIDGTGLMGKIRVWLAKKNYELFLKMNTPAFDYGLNGKGVDEIMMEVIPSINGSVGKEHAERNGIKFYRIKHKDGSQLDGVLIKTAWLATILWAVDELEGKVKLRTDISQSHINDLIVWTRKVME